MYTLKRITMFVLACLLILQGACAPKATPEPTKPPTAVPTKPPTVAPTQPPEPAPVVTTVKIVINGVLEATEFMNKLRDDFNKSHSDIQIEYILFPFDDIGSINLFKENQKTKHFDIVLNVGYWAMAELDSEWLDLTPYIQADNFDMNRFLGKSTELFRFPEQGLLSLPMCVWPSVFYYNVDLFDAAGLAYPPHKYGEKYADGSVWSYDTMVEIAKKLTLDANGNNANSPEFDDKNIKQFGWEGMYRGLGAYAHKFGPENGTGVSKDMHTAVFNSKTYIDTMEFVKKSIWEWHIAPNADQIVFWPPESNWFVTGKNVMVEYMEAPVFLKVMKQKWDIAAVPVGPSGKVVNLVEADTFYIFKSSEHPREAWEVIKWLFQHDNLKGWTDYYQCLSADKALVGGWLEAQKEEYPNVNVDWRVMIDGLDYPDLPPVWSWVPAYDQIGAARDNAYAPISADENADIMALLNEAQKTAQAALDEYWKSH